MNYGMGGWRDDGMNYRGRWQDIPSSRHPAIPLPDGLERTTTHSS